MSRIYFPSNDSGPLRQGEILSDVAELVPVIDDETDWAAVHSGESDEMPADLNRHPIALVMTQDCDLDWDYKARNGGEVEQHKIVPNVLLCELWPAEKLKGHYRLNSTIWSRARANQLERYHILPPLTSEDDALRIGSTDNLAIDFKRIFTINCELLYTLLGHGVQRRSVLQAPFLQYVSNRFGFYQLRVALPEAVGRTAGETAV